MSKKDLKSKILFILCLSALIEGGYTNVYANNIITSPIKVEDGIIITPSNITATIEQEVNIKVNNGKSAIEVSGIDNDISLTFEKNVKIDATQNTNNPSAAVKVYNAFDHSYSFSIITFKADVIIDAGNNYALYAEGNGYSNTSTSAIKINPDNNSNNTIQIIGNICVADYGRIEINLNNSSSYLAGKLEKIDNGYIEFGLKNGAVWYAINDDEISVSEFAITSNGGIIDIAHSKPDTLREGKNYGERPFTFKKMGSSTFNNTTFRITSDVINNKADKIILEDIYANTNNKLTYSIQVVYDPLADGSWTAQPNSDIKVFEVKNKNGNDPIEVNARTYSTDIDAGLAIVEIDPTIEKDNNNDIWKLTGLNIKRKAQKGSAHLFAETGAAINANIAAVWRSDSSDILQRMRDLRNNTAQYGAWGEMYTGKNKVNKGLETELDYRAVQGGVDKEYPLTDGTLIAGAAFSYLEGDIDSSHGSGDADSASLGVYGSWFNNKGHFADLIFKYGHIDNDLKYSNNSNTYKGDFSSNGLSAEFEYGYHLKLDKGFFVEPMVELAYTHIEDSSYTMKLNGIDGARVHNDDYDSLIARAGFNIGRKYGKNSIYLKFNTAHEFAGDIDVRAAYNNTKVKSEISGEDTWVEYGVGFNTTINDTTSIYGALQKTTGDVIETDWHASLGIRYSF